MPIDDLTAFGQKMREARKKKDLTQQELADLSHVSVKQIANIEKGSDTRYKNILTVAYGIYLYLFTHKIFIYKNRMLLMVSCYNLHKFLYIII